MAICTYNARTLASEAAIEDLMMQAKKIKYDVIGLTETRRRSRKVGGVGVLVNTDVGKSNNKLFEQLMSPIERLNEPNAKIGPCLKDSTSEPTVCVEKGGGESNSRLLSRSLRQPRPPAPPSEEKWTYYLKGPPF
ncbi:hypothetical protein RB195_011409 [Necator americanus]|uniref:Endonuclease/exonuclease/phosphatase domain-containing protein n=1 Tax=Necator americanus TaxID=51031 RepID=A0ABR1D295_NECAM